MKQQQSTENSRKPIFCLNLSFKEEISSVYLIYIDLSVFWRSYSKVETCIQGAISTFVFVIIELFKVWTKKNTCVWKIISVPQGKRLILENQHKWGTQRRQNRCPENYRDLPPYHHMNFCSSKKFIAPFNITIVSHTVGNFTYSLLFLMSFTHISRKQCQAEIRSWEIKQWVENKTMSMLYDSYAQFIPSRHRKLWFISSHTCSRLFISWKNCWFAGSTSVKSTWICYKPIPALLKQLSKLGNISQYQKIWKTQQWSQDWKSQFSFQSQRKAMPKNAQTTAQLHSSHMLAK